jgi:hypothetical protein
MLEDHIRISDKIFMINFMKIGRLAFQIFLVAYFISQYWFVFIYASFSINNQEMADKILCEKYIEDHDLSDVEAARLT